MPIPHLTIDNEHLTVNKKLLNDKCKMFNAFGFTLIELMVTVAIIAILSGIGYSTYSSIQANARDAKRKADVDAIAKVLEDKYNSSTGLYPSYSEVSDRDFTSGAKPKQFDGTDYTPQFGSGSQAYKSFVICTTQLEKSTQPYCKYSANGSSSSIGSLPTTTKCSKFNNLIGGQSQSCSYLTYGSFSTNITPDSTIRIDCNDIRDNDIGDAANIICSSNKRCAYAPYPSQQLPWYKEDGSEGGTVVLAIANCSIYNNNFFSSVNVILK